MRATSVFTSTIAVTTETAYRLVHGSPGSGADLRERAYAGRRQPGEQGLQDIGGGPGVGQRPGARPGPPAEEAGKRGELAVGHLGLVKHRASPRRGGENPEGRPGDAAVGRPPRE